ncbi:TIGR01459 family HAD-type hydrolase [Plastorhodobacter daqingensis]|uniref:TIGR01459 family HAD-type hydrolase n=1 Tax=Plastorhodobacter daqingensis TaxID=1387281 RepID=A0ABW2UQR5_9RHOB
MTRIIQSLSDISEQYDALFCDLWGCVHNGQQAYPAAIAALQAFRSKGGSVILMTNAPRPGPAVSATFDRLGIPRDAWDAIVTSGDAAQAGMIMGAVGRKVWHLGPPKDEPFFTEIPDDLRALGSVERVPLEEAEGIVCTGLFDEMSETPEEYRGTLLRAKYAGMKLLCANPDIVVDLGEDRIFCAGALAELYTEMGGQSLYFGKPHPPIYDLARRRLTAMDKVIDDRRILAVGDGIFTDVQGGVSEGIDTLFITGGLAANELGEDPEHPQEALLLPWLQERQLSPSAVIGRLR